jgi:hypothetical protein
MALEAMRKYHYEQTQSKGQERVERMLRKIRNQNVKLYRPGDNIGGNELLIDEMIMQCNARKGYVSKQDLMKVNMMNLMLISQAQAAEKARYLEEKKRRKEAEAPKVNDKLKRLRFKKRAQESNLFPEEYNPNPKSIPDPGRLT